MGKWEKGCLFFLQIAVATWFPPYHCGFSFFFPASIHQRCLAAQSPHYYFKFMEETNRRKSWQHRTFILLPKFKAEHIYENKALLDTFNNMFLYGAVKNVFYLNPTARFHLLRTAATVCALHRTWYESSPRCQSECYACSASALPSCLPSPDTLNYAKFLLARTNEPQASHFPKSAQSEHSWWLCHTSPFSDIAAAPHNNSEIVLIRPSTQKTQCIPWHCANQSWSDTSQRGHQQHAVCTSVGLLWQGDEEGEGEEWSALTKLPRWRQPQWKLQNTFPVFPQANLVSVPSSTSCLSCCYSPSIGATCTSLLKTPSGHVRV